MAINGIGNAAATYAAMTTTAGRPSSAAAASTSVQRRAGTALTLSDQAMSLASSSDKDIQARLDAIKAKPATQRTDEDTSYLLNNDQRLAAIASKGTNKQTAEDIDYVQKACGFVNTMAKLSAGEKQLYNELVAKGQTDAVQGMNLIALARMGSSEVSLTNGRTFDPAETEVTAANVRQLFSRTFVGGDKQADHAFDALASYLDGRAKAAA